jgi:hypothetical protein
MDHLDQQVANTIRQCVNDHSISVSAFDNGTIKLIDHICKRDISGAEVVIGILRRFAADGTLRANSVRNPAAYLATALTKGTVYENGQYVTYPIRTDLISHAKVVDAVLKSVQDQTIYEIAFDESTIHTINRICSDRGLGHIHGPEVVIRTIQEVADSDIFLDHTVKNPAAFLTKALNNKANTAARVIM